MESIYVPQLLRAPEQTRSVQIDDYFPDLATLTPVQGVVKVTHRGNYLDVFGKADTIVTLTCDRCLQQYNHRLVVDTSEIIWLRESIEELEDEILEREVPLDDLVESVDPNGSFDAGQWLYEQLCLAIPQRQICDQTCAGIAIEADTASKSLIDHRWAALEALRNSLN